MKTVKIDRLKNPALFDELNRESVRLDLADQFQKKLRHVGVDAMSTTISKVLDFDEKPTPEQFTELLLKCMAKALESLDKSLDGLKTDAIISMKDALIHELGEELDTNFALGVKIAEGTGKCEIEVDILGDDWVRPTDAEEEGPTEGTSIH